MLRGDRVHDLEHQLFDDDLQAAGADVALERLLGDRLEGVVGEAELDALEAHDGLVLADQRVLRLAENLDQGGLVELTQRGHDGQTADELGDEAEADQIFRMRLREQLAGLPLLLRGDVRAEAHRGLRETALDDRVQPDELASEDEEDVRRVDLDEFLMGVLASALRRNVGDRALDDLQQRLLDTLAADVAGDGGVVALAADLVDLVDVDDAALGLFLVVAGGLVELEDDVLDILADVAGLGQGGGVDDREGHAQHAGQSLREQSLAGAGGADQEDVRLL